MPADTIRPKVVVLIAAVFLALVVVHLWLGAQDTGSAEDEAGPQPSRIEIAEQQQHLEISPEDTADDLEGLIESRIYLLNNGEANEKRATAIQLAYMAGDPEQSDKFLRLSTARRQQLQDALFRGLNDADDVVSDNCRDALIGIWRAADSLAATEQFNDGLAAFRAGRLDLALGAFRNVERLSTSVPPDLYRMKAQVYVSKSLPNRALAECRRALAAEPRNFLAWHVTAYVYTQRGDYEEALKALDAALRIYTRFPRARQLQEEVAELQGRP